MQKRITIVLYDNEYKTLMDVLWYVTHQQEKLADYHDHPHIDAIREMIKANTTEGKE